MATPAPSPLASSVEKANGTKLSRLLIDGGTTILKKIFDHYHPLTNLAADLNANLSILSSLKRRRILNGHQWDKLFPPSGAGPDSNTFDITLLFLLLTSICGLSPPLSGWHKMPPSSDTTLEANLARIKAYRNELYGHVTTTGIQTAMFNGKWKEISSVLVSLGLSQSEADRLKAEPCVEDYVSALMEWTKNDGEIKSQLKELHEQQEKILQVQQEQHSTQQQAVEEILRTQQQAVEVIKEKFENLKKQKEMDRAEDVLKNLVKSEFKGDVKSHAKKFQQGTREWIFKRVQDWLDDRSSPSRVMVISGNAGMGKTVISAVVSQRMQEAGRLSGSHFCQHNNPRYRNPQLMLQSLASHLSHSMAEYKHALAEQLSRNLGRNDLNNMEVEELFALLFKEPLSTLADPGRNTLIVIDGLDESESQGRNELLDVIGSQFCKLPDWIRLLVTTRPERNIVEALRHLKPIELQQNQEENLRDIQVLFEEQLSCHIGDENKTVLLKELVKKSEGLFLFAHFLIEFIQTELPQLTLEQLKSALPWGISSVYLSYFERLEKELRNELKVDEEQFLRFLCVITASREPLPVEIISKILSPSGRTLTTQRRINKAIACISALLPIRDGHLHFFHKSVKDWLSNTTCYGHHDFTVDDKIGHEILFNLCSNELDNIKRKGVEETQFNNAERYALQHCVQHMLEAAAWDDELRIFSIKEELVNDYVTGADLIYAKLCVNSTVASEDLLSVRKQVKQGMLNDQSYLVFDSWLHFLRKHSYMLRDHPHLFFQCLLNEGPELSSKSAKILKSHLPNVPHMAYVDKEEHKGADLARFYCSDTIACFDVSREKDFMVCECRDGTIHLWSLQTCNREWVRPSLTQREFFGEGELRHSAYRQVEDCLSFYRSVVFHWSGKSVLPGTLRQVYSLNGELNDLFPDSDCTFSNCAFTRDQNIILTDCPDERKKVFLWDMGNGEQLNCIPWNEEICSFAISQDGSLIAISDLTGSVVLFDLQSSCSRLFSFDAVCGLVHFTSDNDALACGFLFLTIEEVSPIDYRFVFCRKPVIIFVKHLKDVLLSADSWAPPLRFHFLLWPSVPRRLAESDFIEQDFRSCWVNKVHRLIPSLSAGSYISLSDETALIGSPAHNYLTMVNTGLLSEVTDPVSAENTFKEIIFSCVGDTIYSITESDRVSRAVKVTVWRMSSRELIANKTLPGLAFLIPTKEGVVIVKKRGEAELRNFALSRVIRVLPKLRGSEFTGLFPISDDLIVCWKARISHRLLPFSDLSQGTVSSDGPESTEFDDLSQQNVSSDLPDSAECEDSVQRNVSSDLPDSAEFDDLSQQNVSSDLPDSAECKDSVQRNVSSDLPDSAECEDSVQQNVSSDLPDSTEFDDLSQQNVSSDLPDSAECEDSVRRNGSSDLPDSAECEDSVQRNVSSDLPHSAECEDSVQGNVLSDLPHSAECEDSVQRNGSSDGPESTEFDDLSQQNVSSDLPDSEECEDSVQQNVSSDLPDSTEFDDLSQQNVSSDLPDSAECEDSVRRNGSSDLPDSAECEDSVQRNVSSDLPHSAECEDSVQGNVLSDLPHSAECEDSVQRNGSSDLPDSAECEDSVRWNGSSDLPDSAECEDSVQGNVLSDLPHSAECEDSVQGNILSDLPHSAECEDSVQRNLLSDLPDSAECVDSVQWNVSSDLPDSAECEDSVQQNVSSNLPDSAECVDSVQRNVSSDLPDSAKCEDSVQRNGSSELPDSAECEDSVQRNGSSDLPDSAESEDSVQGNILSDLPHSAECEDSVQRNILSDLTDSAECEDSVQRNVSSDLPDSAECEDSVQRNVSSDLTDSAECEDSVQRNVSSDLPDSAECEDSVQQNVSSDLPDSAECEDSVQRNVSSDLPDSAECEDSVQQNVSSDLPDSAECEDSVQRNGSSDLPDSAESEDSVQGNILSDLPHSAECEDSVQRNILSDLTDSAECEDSVQRNVSSDLPDSAECEDSVQRNVSSDLTDSAECEDSVQRNVSSDLPDSAECEDSVQQNVSSDLPDSAECEDSVQRNVSSDLPDSAECEDSVQQNVSSDLPDSAECEDSVQRNGSSDLPDSAESEDSVQGNILSDLPHSAECEDSVQRNILSDLTDSAECEDSVQRNVSSDLPDSAECEDSVQRNVSSDLTDSAECEDSVQRNVSSDLPDSAECEDSVQQNVSSDLPDSAECEDSVQQNVSPDLHDSAELSAPLEGSLDFNDFLRFVQMFPFLFGLPVVADIFRVSSGELERLVTTFIDFSEDYVLSVSCNSQHQLLVCSGQETDKKYFDLEKVTLSLRNNGTVTSVIWKRDSEWFIYDRPGCSDPHMIFSPQEDFVVTWKILNSGYGIHVLDAKTGETHHVFLKEQEDIVGCKFVDDESLVCCRKDNFLRLFNVKTGHLLSLLDIGQEPFSLGACLHHSLVAIGLKGAKLKFIQVHLPADTRKKKGESWSWLCPAFKSSVFFNFDLLEIISVMLSVQNHIKIRVFFLAKRG